MLPELTLGQHLAFDALQKLTQQQPESTLTRVICTLRHADADDGDCQFFQVSRKLMTSSVATMARSYDAHYASIAFIEPANANGKPIPGKHVMRLIELTAIGAYEYTAPVAVFTDGTPPCICLPGSTSTPTNDPELRAIRNHLLSLP